MYKKQSKTVTEVENIQKTLLTGCNVCGRSHDTDSCSFLRELKHIQDTRTPSRARLTLPANLEVQNLAGNTTTVVARTPFSRVQFGPFIAKHTQMLHPAVNFPLKVFGETEETTYFLDTSDEESCNWMCLVAPATSCKNQNLICYQIGQDIYYAVMKDIQVGEQLRVWYAPYYAVKMGAVPFNIEFAANVNGGKSSDHVYESKQKFKEKEKKNFHGMLLTREVTEKLAEQLPAKHLGARQAPDRWSCRICGVEENSVVSFAKHLMLHYKPSFGSGDKVFKCHLCHKKFTSEKLLIKHKVVRHKITVKRPRLLENVEDEETVDTDAGDAEDSDMLEDNDRVTSIVIANLTGELPPQFSQPGSQTIFVTNTGQIFTNSLTNNELEDRQNEALNLFLDQLQSGDTYESSNQVQFDHGTSDNASQCNISSVFQSASTPEGNQGASNENNGLEVGTEENSFSQNILSEKGTDLMLTHSDLVNQFHPIKKECKTSNILTDYKPGSTMAVNKQQNSSENIINIINSRVTVINNNINRCSATCNDKSVSNSMEGSTNTLVESDMDKTSSIEDNIFESFQSSGIVSEEILPATCPENVHRSSRDKYQIENGSSACKADDRVQVSDVIDNSNEVNSNVNCIMNASDVIDNSNEVNSNVNCIMNVSDVIDNSNEVNSNVNCVINSTVMENNASSNDVSSALLELVSAPSFDMSHDQKSHKDTDNSVIDGNHPVENQIHIPNDFDLNPISEVTSGLPADNAKVLDEGPPYTCDICSKEFHKKDYLYRHLRKHTGEFICVSCLAVFARKESLINHSCFVNASGRTENTSAYTCSFCEKQFLVEKLFKRHVGKHLGEWKCDTCLRSYSSRSSLNSHHCAKKPRPTYQCQVCKKIFLRQSFLNRHVLIHLENQPCVACNKKLPSVEILHKHQKYCTQGKLLESVGETTCPHCNVAFSQLVMYRQHVHQHMFPFVCLQCGTRFRKDLVRALHTCSENLFKCEMCVKQFSSVFNLSRHQIVHGVPPFHCYECGRSFHLYDNFSAHYCNINEEKEILKQKYKTAASGDEESENALAEGNEVNGTSDAEKTPKNRKKTSKKSGGLICDICGDVYKTIHILKAHIQLHGERKFACEICNKKFHRKDVLQEHYTVHQDAQLPCPLCNKKLKTRKSLDVHVHRHTGIQRYSCTDCGKKFFQKGNLLKHAVVHNPQNKEILTCHHCNKKFTSRDYLSHHMLEHTQGRIHVCYLCDKGFIKEHLLKTHIRKFHGGLSFVCPYCNMSVRHRNSMRRHLENRHGDLQHEWLTPGFLDKLETGGNNYSINTSVNIAEVNPQPLGITSTAVPTSEQIATANTDISLAQTDTQPEEAEILLTVSGVPLTGTDTEIQTPVEQTDIGNQMEFQVETELQGNEVPIGNTFIFSDGTVVQQEDGTTGGEILLYVLDPADVAINPDY